MVNQSAGTGYIQEGIWGTDEAAEAAALVPYRELQNTKMLMMMVLLQMLILPTWEVHYLSFTYGFTNNFTYKNFDLNVFLQGHRVIRYYNLVRVRSERSTGDSDATLKRILNRWTPENQNTDVPSFAGITSMNRTNPAGGWRTVRICELKPLHLDIRFRRIFAIE